MTSGAPRGTIACGGYDGVVCLRDPRNKMRATVQQSSPAHQAGVTTIAARGDLLVTCGRVPPRDSSPYVCPPLFACLITSFLEDILFTPRFPFIVVN